MIETINKLVATLTNDNSVVIVADDVLANQLLSQTDVGGKVVYVIDLPTANKPDEYGAVEEVNLIVRVLLKSVYNKSATEEMQVIERAEAYADKVAGWLRCQFDVYGYRKEVLLMQYASLLSGIKLTFVVR